MGSALAVTPAGPMDAPVLARLHAACFDQPWNAAAMATFIASPETLCLIGTAGSAPPAPCGFVIIRRAADEAEILTLGVIPEMRRHGLARKLLERATAELVAAGTKRLFLEVDVANGAAQTLYRSLGAEIVGQRDGYYETGADAAILCLTLPEPARR